MSPAAALTRLSGDGRARGRAHGRTLGPQVRGHVAAWLAALEKGGVGEPRAYVARMLAETDYLSAIEAETPDLLEEARGVAEGAELPFELVLGLQLLDEEWAYRIRSAGAGHAPDKCSSVGLLDPQGQAWIGQNMDLGSYTDGWQALLRIEAHAGAPDALVFTCAGLIGLMGVNAAGVGVCVNSLPQLPSAPRGLPVAFVLRRLLQAASLDEASDLVARLPHATNQHYLIGGPQGFAAFEASSAGVVEYRSPHPGRVLHTNHPLAAEGAPEPAQARANSVARLASLESRLAGGPRGLADIQGALQAFDDPAHPVCRLHDAKGLTIGFTTGSMVSKLTPGAVESHVSFGPPSLAGYRTFSLAAEAAL